MSRLLLLVFTVSTLKPVAPLWALKTAEETSNPAGAVQAEPITKLLLQYSNWTDPKVPAVAVSNKKLWLVFADGTELDTRMLTPRKGKAADLIESKKRTGTTSRIVSLESFVCANRVMTNAQKPPF